MYTWFAGEDINWDWRNYHEYGAFAWINGRFDADVAPGGFQTFLNPLPYLPAYLLRHYVSAPFWGMLLGAFHGLNLALIYWFSRVVFGASGNAWALAAAVVIAAFGPMTLSEVGTSFADILTALPIIAGFGLTLSASAQQRERYVLAGILVGAAGGLKLTNTVYFIGAAISLLYAPRPMMAFCYFALGGTVGGLGSGGAWAWKLWAEFGNPVFPFYNEIFRSPEAAFESITDIRFMPHSLLDAFAYPFYWAVGDHRSSELSFRDPRFAVASVLLITSAGVGLWYRLSMFTRRDRQFLLFFLVAYAIWLTAFSIHRYAVALELLCAPLIVLLFLRLSRVLRREAFASKPTARVHRWVNVATIGVATTIALWSQPSDWLRRPWSDPYEPRLPRQLPQAASYLVIEKPLGYIVPLLGTESRTYQLADIVMPIVPGEALDQRIRADLASPPPGGVWTLHLRNTPPRQDLLNEYGWQIDASQSCVIIPGADGLDIEACPLRRYAGS